MTFKLEEYPGYNKSGKTTLNGTVFDGESVLRAVERVAPLPCVGMGGAWYRHQIVLPEEYERVHKKIWGEYLDAVDSGEVPPGPCLSVHQVVRAGWRFLYQADYRGDWHTVCYTFATPANG